MSKKDTRKHIAINPATHARLSKLGTVGDSFDSVLNALIDEHERSEGTA